MGNPELVNKFPAYPLLPFLPFSRPKTYLKSDVLGENLFYS